MSNWMKISRTPEYNPSKIESKVNQLEFRIDEQSGLITQKVSKDDMSSMILQNAESVVTAINSTDGVGRIKTTNVIIDEKGLTIDNGSLIVKDKNNKAIVTSNGLKMKYLFVSTGTWNGWSPIGIYEAPDGVQSYEALLFVYIPENFIIESAILHTKSLPFYRTNEPYGAPDGFYHAKQMALHLVQDESDISVWIDGYSTEKVRVTDKLQISKDVWGIDKWSPEGRYVQIITGNVKNYLNEGGRTVFLVQSRGMAATVENTRYQGLLQMELEVSGFLRG